MGGKIPGGNFLGGGDFPGGSLMGGSFLGGNFPRTVHEAADNWINYHGYKCLFPSVSYIDSHTFFKLWRALSNYQNCFYYMWCFAPFGTICKI